ncbi:MAG: cysteine--tRNA ligase [Candidatus Neomarinimicrobiota bacterium]
MALRLYNSLSKKKELFVPLKKNKVSIYTCGPTVYDWSHVGNFRTFLFEDLLKRFLILQEYEVTHVMNITDVDDKTIKKSQASDQTLAQLTDKYTQAFFLDCKRLKLLPADFYPRATEHIESMHVMIQSLLDKKVAYKTRDGSIFFALARFPAYGRLARIDPKQRSTSRVESDDYDLENPRDFVLWKAWKKEDGPVYWDSPWGRGRPGWHLECSAMSIKYLGNHFDIHCGGIDNLFPHHENEIAQSEAATGEPFVNVWLHSEHLMVEGGKMSKSLQNFYKITDLLEAGFTPETIRYILLSAHYRKKLIFSKTKNHEALRAIKRISELKIRLEVIAGSELIQEYPDYYQLFIQALEDDLNTPKALGQFFEWARKTNLAVDLDKLSPAAAGRGLNFILAFNSVFDILPKGENIPESILNLVKEREAARKNKDWSKSDEIRDELYNKGWTVQDSTEGSTVQKI